MQKDFYQRLEDYCSLKDFPDHDTIFSMAEKAADVLETEPKVFRPWSKGGQPGGLIDFSSYKKQLPLIIVPDIHARYFFVKDILDYIPPEGFLPAELTGKTIYEALSLKALRIVCVGDALHSELRGRFRWLKAQEEYENGIFDGPYMREEMIENMNLLCLLMDLKKTFPKHFHFLKGNHENIMNVRSAGDFPFRKFAAEGEMVRTFIQHFYGDDVLMMISCWENALPLVAAFNNCVISHAEPQTYFKRSQVINGRFTDSIVTGLTWTANDTAEEGSVIKMLPEFTRNKNIDEIFYFAGHRPVGGNYRLRQNGKFVQIHNPELENIVLIYTDKIFNPDTDIVSVSGDSYE